MTHSCQHTCIIMIGHSLIGHLPLTRELEDTASDLREIIVDTRVSTLTRRDHH